jgi:uncharacterized damage-inducible protein DinB
MASCAAALPIDPYQVLLENYAVNERTNQLLLEHLDPRVWRAKAPGSRGRTIAAIFAHMHNVRCKWLRLSTPKRKLPSRLERTRCTQEQVKTALAESARSCTEMLASALSSRSGRKFLRDGWAKAWPAGAAMVVYMIAHDTHHRGQVCMLAQQLGSPLPAKVDGGMWNWEKLWRECGFTGPR